MRPKTLRGAWLEQKGMQSTEFFFGVRDVVLEEWVNAIFDTYPFQTTGFLRTQSDPFVNPVADMTREAARTVYEAVSGWDKKPSEVKEAIDRFVHMRAVQGFNPSQAMLAFYLLKPVLRKHVLPAMQKAGRLKDYLDAESRLDTIVLLGFDMYTESREVVAQNRIDEIKNQHAQLVRWAQRVEGAPLPDGEPERHHRTER